MAGQKGFFDTIGQWFGQVQPHKVDLIGRTLDHYHIIEPLGEGGMAIVYKAHDLHLDRFAAVKVIRKDMVPPAQLGEMLKRFKREGRALSQLEHENIVRVYDYGEYEGSPYLVMQYLPGGTLKHLGNTPMSYPEAARLLAPIARALEFAHSEGFIHRDIKPANILLTKQGKPMLTDFGIAKIMDVQESTILTRSGISIGTPDYMAPEQWEGKATRQTDIYALGVVFFELLTGRRPYMADTPWALMKKVISDPLPRPRQFAPDLPDEVEGVLFKALSKNPDERYPSMGEFVLALEQLAGVSQPSPRPQLSAQSVTIPLPGRDEEAVSEPRESGSMIPTDWGKAEPQLPASQLFSQPGAGCGLEQEEQQAARARLKTPLMIAGIALAGLLLLGGLAGVAGIGYYFTRPTVTLSPTPTATRTTPPMPTSTPTPGSTAGERSTPEPARLSTATPGIAPVPDVKNTSTPTITLAPARTNPKDQAALLFVPAGEFIMGSDLAQDPYFWGAEGPSHKVRLSKPFWIYRTEVTNKMFSACVQAVACPRPEQTYSNTRDKYYGNSDYDNYPVIYVTWVAATSYCRWAGGRLPTEAEWEKAARGEDGRLFPWGNITPTSRQANLCDSNCPVTPLDGDLNDGYRDTAPVGNYPTGASPYGLLDVAGNAWEWVNDFFSATYYRTSPLENPPGPGSSSHRTIRGGSFINRIDGVRAAARYGVRAEVSLDTLGFRCVVDDK